MGVSKMYCTKCNQEVETQVISKEETVMVKDEKITCKSRIRVCNKCGEEIYDEELDRENLQNFYNEYRLKNDLLTPDDIKSIRLKYGISQSTFAKILGLGEKTIARYEGGAIQEKAQDNLIKLMRDVNNFILLWQEVKDNLTITENTKITSAIGIIKLPFKYVGNSLGTWKIEKDNVYLFPKVPCVS